MAEYIDIDMPLDVFTVNGKSYKLFSTTLREFLECNEIPYKAADVVPGSDFRDCRNELCLRCGQYKTAHLGSCDGCRWRH